MGQWTGYLPGRTVSRRSLLPGILVKGGWFFAKVVSITPERKFGEAEALKVAREKVREDNSKKAYKEWTEKLRPLADIDINEAGIKAFLEANKPPPIRVEGLKDEAAEGTGPKAPATPAPAPPTPAAPATPVPPSPKN